MRKTLQLLLKILPIFVLLYAAFSHAQLPPPIPTNPYPWTQQAEYSPQYYDWEPLRYFGPKYSGYLNTEEASVYIARSLTIRVPDQKKPLTQLDTVAEKLNIAPAIYKTGVDRETNEALIAGSVRRNDAITVSLKLNVLHEDKITWSSSSINYSVAALTATDKKTDLLPFVFDKVPVDVDLKDKFEIIDSTTNQRLFGPMSFETLGDIEKLEKPFDDSWYYKVVDDPLQKSVLYKTKDLCLAAIPLDLKRTSTDPECYQDGGFAQKYDLWWFYYKTFNPRVADTTLYKTEVECKKAGKLALSREVICYTKHLKTIDIDLVTDNNFVVGNEVKNYSKITNTSAHLLFRADTYGSTADLGVYYIKYSDLGVNPVVEPKLVNIHSGVHSDFGKSVILTSDIAGLTKNTKYQIYVIDQSDLVGIKDDKGDPMTVSKVKKLFEGTIFTKEVHSFILNTLPVLSDKLAPKFNLTGIFNGEGGSNDLRLVTCGYDGADIITTVDNQLKKQPGPIDGKLMKPDPYFDKNGDGKIDGDGQANASEWKDKNGMEKFQPHGETCDFDDIIGIIRRALRYLLVIVPLIAAGMFAYAGFLFLTQGGNAGKVKEAKDIMWYTIIGIAVILLAWLLVANIYVLLGIDKSWSWLKL